MDTDNSVGMARGKGGRDWGEMGKQGGHREWGHL